MDQILLIQPKPISYDNMEAELVSCLSDEHDTGPHTENSCITFDSRLSHPFVIELNYVSMINQCV